VEEVQTPPSSGFTTDVSGYGSTLTGLKEGGSRVYFIPEPGVDNKIKHDVLIPVTSLHVFFECPRSGFPSLHRYLT